MTKMILVSFFDLLHLVVLSDTYHRSQICVCLHGSLVAQKFTNKIFPSNYTSEATENTIFAQNPPSVFFICAYINYGIR